MMESILPMASVHSANDVRGAASYRLDAAVTLVRRAAFTQGFALPHLPVRGRGTAGPAVKPGWGGAS